MNILLIDVDSTIPNLALMKISAYHKTLGDEVSIIKMPQNINLFEEKIDKVYASIIFSKNKHLANDLSFFYPDSEIIIGGSGYDLNIKLPDKIELLKPDYSLYPDINYSLGYTTRGCDRDCSFCIVPQKEGCFKISQHPSSFINEKFKNIVFLDNNILFDKKWFYEVIDFCKNKHLLIDFNQGLDIRLINEEDIIKLLEIKMFRGYRFAFDDSKLSGIIYEKIKLMEKHGVKTSNHTIKCYVYVDNEEQYDDAVWRCRFLKKINVTPFVQFNINNIPSRKIKNLIRWANNKYVFWACDIEDYKKEKL